MRVTEDYCLLRRDEEMIFYPEHGGNKFLRKFGKIYETT
jgi:hypothetical protein